MFVYVFVIQHWCPKCIHIIMHVVENNSVGKYDTKSSLVHATFNSFNLDRTRSNSKITYLVGVSWSHYISLVSISLILLVEVELQSFV